MINKFESFNIARPEQEPLETEPKEKNIEKDVEKKDIGEKKEDALTRREFLKRTLAAGLGGAAAFYFPNIIEKAEADVVREKEKPEFEKVKEATVKNIKDNQNLKEQLNEQKIEELCQFIKGLDIGRVNTFIAELGGLKKEKMNFNKIRSLAVWSDKDWQNMEMSKSASGYVLNYNMGLKASSFIDKQYFKKANLLLIFLHEYSHVVSADNRKQWAEAHNWLDKYSINEDLYEGATELQALQLLRRYKLPKPSIYAYTGGGTFSALMVSEVVGSEKFSRDYYKGEIKDTKRAFERKFGQGTFNELFLSKRHPILEMVLGGFDDLDAVHGLYKLYKKKKYDCQPIFKEAEKLGITENIKIMDSPEKEVSGVISALEKNGKLGLRAVFESRNKLSKNTFPLLVRFSNRGIGYDQEGIDHMVKLVQMTVKDTEEVCEEMTRRKASKEQIDAFRRDQYICFKSNINIMKLPEVKQWLSQYEQTDDSKIKDKLRNQIADHLEKVGAEFIKAIEDRVKPKRSK